MCYEWIIVCEFWFNEENNIILLNNCLLLMFLDGIVLLMFLDFISLFF